MTDQPAPDATPEEASPTPTPQPGTPGTVPTQPPSRPPRSASPLIWIASLALAAVVGAALFVGGFLAAGGTGSSTGCAAPDQAFAAFCQAFNRLKDQYVDNLDDTKLAEGAIQGMFQYGVADPFSGYMPPEQYQSALDDLSGTFSGIGAQMGVKNLDDPGNLDACTSFSESCVLVVVAPLQGSPAEKAGLQAGDIVTAVDGTSIDGLTLNDAVSKVRGEAGTDVTLSITRDGKAMELTITREQIQQHEVSSRMLEDGTTGYIALNGFTDAAASDFHDALAGLLDQGATAIIFDLRNNGGGYIDAANKIASEFVKSGLIFSQESSGNQVKDWNATGDGLATDPNLPVVVLVNSGSASASEIVTAALKEHHRATIIGQHTYGKNTVQIWSELENGGGVRITISRWFTPDHNSVAPDGVQPDVTVTVPDNTPAGQDLYLQAAQQYLANHGVGSSAAPAAVLPLPEAALDPSWAPVSIDVSGLTLAAA